MIAVMNMGRVGRGLQEALLRYEKEVVEATRRAAGQLAQEIIDDSRGETPVETGELLRSAVATSGVSSGSAVEAEAGYDAPYAAHVHEDTEGRQPKFLERASMAVGPRFPRIVLKELR